MVLQETLSVEEVVVEEEALCLYCHKSDYVKVGVSSAIIGLAFFLSIAYVVWTRGMRMKARKSLANDEEQGIEDVFVSPESVGSGDRIILDDTF